MDSLGFADSPQFATKQKNRRMAVFTAKAAQTHISMKQSWMYDPTILLWATKSTLKEAGVVDWDLTRTEVF